MINDLPKSSEAEQVVLGDLLVDGSVFTQFLLEPEDFYWDEHRQIYRAMQELYRKNIPIDIVSVGNELKENLSFIGGYSYLSKLAGGSIGAVNFYYYAKIVKTKSNARQIFEKAQEIKESAIREDLVSARKKAQEIIVSGVKEDLPISEMFTEEDLERLSKSKRWFSEGMKKLTHFVWFLRKEVIYIAGETSTGKSQMAINLALDFLKQGARVGYLSFELGKEQLLRRLISWELSVSLSEVDIRVKSWFDFGMALLTQGFFKDFYFRDDVFDVNEVMSWINAHDLDVVFVDYLQMMHDKTFRGSRNDELGNIAREFRKMSVNRCFVVLSQFNRSREEEDEIDMSRIRDSGEIEQTSTSVILIRRDKKEKEKFYYAVAKNQSNGKLTYGWVPLSFETGGKFKEIDSDDI